MQGSVNIPPGRLRVFFLPLEESYGILPEKRERNRQDIRITLLINPLLQKATEGDFGLTGMVWPDTQTIRKVDPPWKNSSAS